jgi:outer membrane protein assembly factor BamB
MRRICFVLLGSAVGVASLICLARVPAQAPVNPPPTRPTFSHIVSLPTDSDRELLLAKVQEHIRAKDWADVAVALQQLNDEAHDVFVPRRDKEADGQEIIRWVSSRAQANRVLATLPPDGRAFYETIHGPKAGESLRQAKKTNDPHLLAQITERYRHTRAGAEAAELLGTYYLDRGQYGIAARCFQDLINDSMAKRTPATLYKAALAFQGNGETTKAEETWKRLTVSAPDGIRVGDRLVGLAELKNGFQQPKPATSAGLTAWTMFRGDPSRSASSAAGAPRLQPHWQVATVAHPQARTWIESALDRARGQSILPANEPLATQGKVIYRSQRGVHAVDAGTGAVLWESRLAGGLEDLAEDPAKHAHAGSWIAHYLENHAHLLLENSIVGCLSADGRQVYAVEDLAVPPYPNNTGGFANRQGSGLQLALAPQLTSAAYHSRLLALDLATGIVNWEQGGQNEKAKARPLENCHFLAAPVPIAGKLYTVVEKEARLRLVCLDATTGDVAWMQPLATPRHSLLLELQRRAWAAHVSHADGVLVCSTHAGAVVAVDLLSRNLLWAYSYRDEPPPPVERFGKGRGFRNITATLPAFRDLTWRVSGPVLYQGKAILTAPDGATIDVLDARDGRLLWKAEWHTDDVCVGPVYQDRVVLVGKRSLRSLRLADGKELWKLETGAPAGHGIAAGKTLHLPMQAKVDGKGAEILSIDLDNGTIAARHPAAAGVVLGNLIAHDGWVFSQTPTAVTAFPQANDKRMSP